MKGHRLAAWLVLILCLAVTSLGVAQTYPDCRFSCASNDVVLEEIWIEVGIESCASGDDVSGTIYGRFYNRTNTERGAVRILADLYVGGSFLQRLDACVASGLSPGASEFPIGSIRVPCSSGIALRNVIVSWGAGNETCGDAPRCAERGSKCSLMSEIRITPTFLTVSATAQSPVCPGAPVQFTSTAEGDAPPYSYRWDFGDGFGTSTAAAPMYAYPGPGMYVATLTVTDQDGASSTASVEVEVLEGPLAAAANDGPYRTGDTASLVAEGGTTYQWVGPAGFLSSLQTPIIPSISRDTIGTYTVTVSDERGCSAQATTELELLPNEPPVAFDDAATLHEDTATPIALVATDPDRDVLVYAIVVPPEHGKIVGYDSATGTLTYVPDPEYHGPDRFTFEVDDPWGGWSRATVELTVLPVNDPPLAFDDQVTLDEDTEAPIALSAVDVDGDPLVYAIVAPPSHGTIVGFDPGTGTLTYVPEADFAGADRLTFEACDPSGLCDRGTVEFEVVSVNDPPVARDQNHVTSEDTPTGFFRLAISDPDHRLAELACDCVVAPQHGTVERGPEHTVNYTPDAGFSGIDVFTYEVCDPEGVCDRATVTVIVTNVNDNPTVDAAPQRTLEDVPVSVPVVHSDPDGDPLECVISGPYHGTVAPMRATVSGPYPVESVLVYTPVADYHGTDQLTITCDDGLGGTDSVTVEITIVAQNDPPWAWGGSRQLEEDTRLPLQLIATDPDGDALAYAIVTPPEHGAIVGFDPVTGMLTYVPDPDYHGPDRFEFRVCDPSGACDVKWFDLTVTPVNDPPIAGAGWETLFEDTPTPIQLLASDPEGDPLTFTILTGPSHGRIRDFDPVTGQLRYVPDLGYVGPDTIAFQVCDPGGLCDQEVVRIQVVRAGGGGEAECPTRVIISEIAWAGTYADASHEWIELRNLEDREVDLSGWMLRWRSKGEDAVDDRVWTQVELSGWIGAAVAELPLVPSSVIDGFGVYWIPWSAGPMSGGHFLVERGSDQSVSDVPADQVVFAGSADPAVDPSLLSDGIGTIVELVDPNGCVASTANTEGAAEAGWAAGDAGWIASMERTRPDGPDRLENWHTNLGAFSWGLDASGRPIWGTPGGQNAPDIAAWIEANGLTAMRVEDAVLSIRIPADRIAGLRSGLVPVVRIRLDGELAMPADRQTAVLTSQTDCTEVSFAISTLPAGRHAGWLRLEGGVLLILFDVP